uniref:Uncharacterized protein n=1 Tax=Rhizophora mucronata TaxID=61149 RepID=A0A2P2NQV2_RHIMU
MLKQNSKLLLMEFVHYND